MPHDLDSTCASGGSNCDLKIKEVRVRSIWLFEGSIAAPLSVFSGVFTANSLTHWWVEIETTSSNIWFCAQFNKPDLELIKCSSLEEVTRAGKRCGGRENEDINITNKSVFRPHNVTMGEVYRWMKRYDDDYFLLTNNCQRFGNDFSMRFGGSRAANNPIMHTLDAAQTSATATTIATAYVSEQIVRHTVVEPIVTVAAITKTACIIS